MGSVIEDFGDELEWTALQVNETEVRGGFNRVLIRQENKIGAINHPKVQGA